ncbi:hypothetical protein JCM16161A_05430 [Vulcanisaeta sp. JCM 16161]|uniref:hypothetical protein n=1 Tax=Vulcanisaeta sp. JCM 16161 TaxID=1295372 RepID=UPI0006CF66D9|nr:hypothetical protein [Vulcanisaeta sp. JCM 16161]
MNELKCVENLLNALMTFYSVAVIEHYMILLLLTRSKNTESVRDQLLNVVRDHLDKENRILSNTSELMECIDEHTMSLINRFAKDVQDGVALVNDPEFISNYINDFTIAVKDLTRYILNHTELLSSIINLLWENVRKYMGDFT